MLVAPFGMRQKSDDPMWHPLPPNCTTTPGYTQARLDHALEVFRIAQYSSRRYGIPQHPRRQLRSRYASRRLLTEHPRMPVQAWETSSQSNGSDDEYDPDDNKRRKKRKITETKRTQKRKSNDIDSNDDPSNPRQLKQGLQDEEEEEDITSRHMLVILRVSSKGGIERLEKIHELATVMLDPMSSISRSGKVRRREAITSKQEELELDTNADFNGRPPEEAPKSHLEEDNLEVEQPGSFCYSSTTHKESPDVMFLGSKPWLGVPSKAYSPLLEVGYSLDSPIIIDDDGDEEVKSSIPRLTHEPEVAIDPFSFTPPTIDNAKHAGMAHDTTIMTHFAHPMDLKHFPKQGTSTQCSFCLDYKMGVIGYRLKAVKVRVYPDQPYRFHELGGGYRSMGKPTTKMCRDCAYDRLMILRCHDPETPTQQRAKFARLDVDTTSIAALMRDLMLAMKGHSSDEIGIRTRNTGCRFKSSAPSPVCNLCPGAAIWRCATVQEPKRNNTISELQSEGLNTTASELAGISKNTPEPHGVPIVGCGLHLCDACHAFFTAPVHSAITNAATGSDQPHRYLTGCDNVLNKDALRSFLRRSDVDTALGHGRSSLERQQPRNILGPRADLELLWPGGILEKAYENENR